MSTCRRPSGCGGAPGSVTSTRSARRRCVELARRERVAARLDQPLERLARLVGGLADGAALLGGQRGDAAQQLRQLGLAAEVAHAQLLQLGARAAARDRALGLALQLLDPVDHDAGTVSVGRAG